ncbi:unnamed protein product [Blepharisma stoltei]|uniref:Secreted protein n=1 Tax=Blepharisma stoltei TaxID=1481888 RepID=A0AAU9KDP0_9CILI|nr:unnamed protein product [Blepharisma stoltei]
MRCIFYLRCKRCIFDQLCCMQCIACLCHPSIQCLCIVFGHTTTNKVISTLTSYTIHCTRIKYNTVWFSIKGALGIVI